jgi:excisionase family DNA binding protein
MTDTSMNQSKGGPPTMSAPSTDPPDLAPERDARQALPAAETVPARTFLTVREASLLLEVSEDTIERACKAGELPATRLGRQWRIHAAPVHARRDGGLEWLLRQHGRLFEIREAHRQASELHRRLSDLEAAYVDALTPGGGAPPEVE